MESLRQTVLWASKNSMSLLFIFFQIHFVNHEQRQQLYLGSRHSWIPGNKLAHLLFTYLICLFSIGQAFSHKKYYSNTNTFSGYSAQYLSSILAKSFSVKLYWNLKLCRSPSPTLLRFEIV